MYYTKTDGICNPELLIIYIEFIILRFYFIHNFIPHQFQVTTLYRLGATVTYRFWTYITIHVFTKTRMFSTPIDFYQKTASVDIPTDTSHSVLAPETVSVINISKLIYNVLQS